MIDAIKLDFVQVCKSLLERGYATGGAGNVSIKLDNGNILTTPTASSLGRLDIDRLSEVTMSGEHIAGDRPSKEVNFHLAIYRNRLKCGAIVHLHSTALSCIKNLNAENAIEPFTPYYVMRVGSLPVVPYYKPVASKISESLAELAPIHSAFLLANHGPVVCVEDLYDATNNAEELEETAKLQFMLSNHQVRYLSKKEITELKSMSK